MTVQISNRKVYLQLFILFAFLLISLILVSSGSVKSFAELNSVREKAKSSQTRWITVDGNELRHIQNVVQNKGESFELKIVEQNGGLSVIESEDAAEEVGLRGSNAIAADFQARAVNVVGVLQLDMTNYKSSDSTFDIAIITDSTNAAQNQFIRDLIQTYQSSVTFANAACGYSCSDHASWTNKGFPASFPFEPRSNPTIHTTRDTLAQSGNNASHAVKYSKIALSYIGEMAKGRFGKTRRRIAFL